MAHTPPALGAPLPPLAPPTLQGLNPSTIHSFKRAALAQPPPYGLDHAPMYAYWAGDGPRTPAQLSTEAVSSKVQWFLAYHSGIQSYIVLHDPFVYPTAPGLNHPRGNQTIWVINDVSSTDASLAMVDQPSNLFHVASATYVPSDDDFTAAMSLAGPGISEIAPVADPTAAGWVQVGNHLRCCHPLPHKFVVRALTLVQGGLAGHKTMWEGLAPNILSEAAETTAHRSLLDFLKITATRRAPVTGQAGDRPPESQLPFSATFVDDTIRYQMAQIKTARLPGLAPVIGATAQLATLQHNQLSFFQAQAVAKARTKTLSEYNPNIASAIRAIAQVSSDLHLPSYWRSRADLKASDYQQQLQRCCDTLASNKRWSPPVVSHDLATEVAQGRIHSPGILNVTNGLSIFLIWTNSSPSAEHVRESARMLQLITQGGHAAPIDTMQQMMVHKDLEVVTSTTHFINTLQAYGVVLEVVVGCSTTMIAYESDILDGLYEWTAVLESEYQNQPQIRLTAFMIILTYIWRVTNNHFTALLRNPVVPPPAPAYGRIHEHLVQGTILHLTALPDQVAIKTFTLPPPVPYPQVGGSVPGGISTDMSAITGGTSRSAPPGGASRSGGVPPPAGDTGQSQPDPLTAPHRLNKLLQEAWEATGTKMLFSRAAPGNRFFKDDPATRNRVVVMADNGTDPICLPYALNGRCYQNCGKRSTTHRALTRQEVDRVAAAATPPLPL